MVTKQLFVVVVVVVVFQIVHSNSKEKEIMFVQSHVHSIILRVSPSKYFLFFPYSHSFKYPLGKMIVLIQKRKQRETKYFVNSFKS